MSETTVERLHGTMILYKYRPWNIHTAQGLANSTLYYSSCLDFNDPYDSRIPATFFDVSDAEYREALSTVGTPQEAKAVIRAQTHRLPHVRETMKQMAHEKHASYGIACLSSVRDDILMWSHYADGHRGVCLKYEWNSDRAPAYHAYEVKYDPNPPRLKITDALVPPGTVPFIVSKSNRWCYEKEYRVIKDGKGLEPVPPAWLKGVVLGQNAWG